MKAPKSNNELRRYTPNSEMPWNVERVVHLHRRAGFGATWEQVIEDLREGPEAAITRVLEQPHAPSETSHLQEAESSSEFEKMSQVIGDAAVGSGDIHRLKAWWLYRMLFTHEPLTERLTLCWHNHFATSFYKIEDLSLMRQQNEKLRTYSRGNFAELLSAVIQDPAMLIWLDADSNRKEHPNENLARELMELFTIGVGNYTETDVRETARALTGWTVARGKFRFDERLHDTGDKTILGKTGSWNGADVLNLLTEQPAIAKRIAFRIGELLLGESVATEAVIDEPATGLRENQLNIAWGIETVLRSELFFSEKNIGNRVRSPVEFLIGTARSLEMNSPPPGTWLLAEWAKRLGEDLFNPPNVFGWSGGRAWLTSRTMIGRANFASALMNGELTSDRRTFDARKLAEKYGFVKSSAIGNFYAQLLLGQSTLPERFASKIDDTDEWIVTLLASPESQIG